MTYKNVSLLIMAGVMTFLFGCKRQPTASFDQNNTSGLTYSFTNTSENGKTYEWDFGDGQTATLTNPNHTYTSPGIYTVTLTAYSKKEKKSDVATATINAGIWNGPIMTFTKADGADWTLAANQDRITNNVWITRANNQGIFNIADEASYEDFQSPTKTRWAYGTLSNLSTLSFDDWESTHGSSPPSTVNQNMVVHLLEDNVYLSIKFTSWATGGGGGMGGFSYERSTKP